VSVELFKKTLGSNNYDFYICGPPPMMESVVGDLKAWGVPDDRIHFEAFGPATVKKKVPSADGVAAQTAGAIEVTFAKSGKTISWTAASGSLLELGEANGVKMDSGCRAGNCGTCTVALKQGDVGYLTPPGSPPNGGTCLACIAIPKSPVTLDA
jgi:ferredoxin